MAMITQLVNSSAGTESLVAWPHVRALDHSATGSQGGIAKSAAAASCNFSERQILGANPRPTESETLGIGPKQLCLTSPPGMQMQACIGK